LIREVTGGVEWGSQPLAVGNPLCEDQYTNGRDAMNPITQFPLRKIAEKSLDQHIGILDADVRAELATSMVRQWLGNDGHAGFVTPTRRYWFQVIAKGDRLEVGFSSTAGDLERILADDWHVDPAEVPGLLHRLNLCQTARCRNGDGKVIRMRVEPNARTVSCQEEPEAEGTEL
jgi:hypothetical protein